MMRQSAKKDHESNDYDNHHDHPDVIESKRIKAGFKFAKEVIKDHRVAKVLKGGALISDVHYRYNKGERWGRIIIGSVVTLFLCVRSPHYARITLSGLLLELGMEHNDISSAIKDATVSLQIDPFVKTFHQASSFLHDGLHSISTAIASSTQAMDLDDIRRLLISHVDTTARQYEWDEGIRESYETLLGISLGQRMHMDGNDFQLMSTSPAHVNTLYSAAIGIDLKRCYNDLQKTQETLLQKVGVTYCKTDVARAMMSTPSMTDTELERYTEVLASHMDTLSKNADSPTFDFHKNVQMLGGLFGDGALIANACRHPELGEKFSIISVAVERLTTGTNRLTHAVNFAGLFLGGFPIAAGFAVLSGLFFRNNSLKKLETALVNLQHSMEKTFNTVLRNQEKIFNAVRFTIDQLVKVDHRLRHLTTTTQTSLKFLALLPLQEAFMTITHYVDGKGGGISLTPDDIRRALHTQEHWLQHHMQSPAIAHADCNVPENLAIEILQEGLIEETPMSLASFVLMRIQWYLRETNIEIPLKYLDLPPFGLFAPNADAYCNGVLKARLPSDDAYHAITRHIIEISGIFQERSYFLKENTTLWKALYHLYIQHQQTVIRIVANSRCLILNFSLVQHIIQSHVSGYQKQRLQEAFDKMEELRLLLLKLSQWIEQKELHKFITALASKESLLQMRGNAMFVEHLPFLETCLYNDDYRHHYTGRNIDFTIHRLFSRLTWNNSAADAYDFRLNRFNTMVDYFFYRQRHDNFCSPFKHNDYEASQHHLQADHYELSLLLHIDDQVRKQRNANYSASSGAFTYRTLRGKPTNLAMEIIEGITDSKNLLGVELQFAYRYYVEAMHHKTPNGKDAYWSILKEVCKLDSFKIFTEHSKRKDVNPHCLLWLVCILGRFEIFQTLPLTDDFNDDINFITFKMPNPKHDSWHYYSDKKPSPKPKCVLTPLMVAAKIGREDVIDGLIQRHQQGKQIGLNTINSQGETAASIAIKYGHVYIAEKLVRLGAKLTEEERAQFNAICIKQDALIASKSSDMLPPISVMVPSQHDLDLIELIKLAEQLASQEITPPPPPSSKPDQPIVKDVETDDEDEALLEAETKQFMQDLSRPYTEPCFEKRAAAKRGQRFLRKELADDPVVRLSLFAFFQDKIYRAKTTQQIANKTEGRKDLSVQLAVCHPSTVSA